MRILIGLLLASSCWGAATIAPAAAGSSVNAAGTTWTIALSGVTGACSPGSGLTGVSLSIVISSTNYTIPTSAVGCSGTGASAVITATATFPVMLGDSLSMTLAAGAGSNITDGSGNTSAGGTVPLANNSTVTSTDVVGTNVQFQGNWGATTGSNPSHRTPVGPSPANLQVTGTDMGCMVWGGGSGSLTYIVDGTATALSSLVPNVWQVWPIFTGLSNTSHIVTLQPQILGIAPFSCRIIGTGTNSQPAAYNGSGGVLYPILAGTAAGVCGVDGGPEVQTGKFTDADALYINQMDSMWRCPSNAGATDLYFYGAVSGSATFVCYQDGAPSGTGTTFTPGNLVWQYIHACTGLLNDGNPHMTQLYQTQPSSGQTFFYGMLFTGSTIGSAVQSNYTLIDGYGDSLVAVSGTPNTNVSSTLTAEYNQIVNAINAAGGTKITDRRVGNPGATVTLQLSTSTYLNPINASPCPAVEILEGAVNDQHFAEPIGTPTTAGTFEFGMVTMMNSRATACPNTQFLVREIEPNGDTNFALRSNYAAGQVAATNYYNAHLPGGVTKTAIYLQADWFQCCGSYQAADKVHWNQIAQDAMTQWEIPLIAGFINGQSYSASGPSTGHAGTPSGNFTVTLAAGATAGGCSAGGTAALANCQTYTISDGGSGCTVTPSVGSPGATPLTVTLPIGQAGFTFTYQCATPGARTISLAHDATLQAGWVDPSPLSLNILSVAAGSSMMGVF